MPPGATILTVQGISKSFGTRTVLRDVSFAPLDNAAVTVKVTAPDGKPIDLTAEASAKESGVYEAAYVPRQSGAYRVQAELVGGGGHR